MGMLPRCNLVGSAKSAAARWGLLPHNKNLTNCGAKISHKWPGQEMQTWLNPQKLYSTAFPSRLSLGHVANIQWVPQIFPVSFSFKAKKSK